MNYRAFAILPLISAGVWAQDAPDPRIILEKAGSVYRAPSALELKGVKTHEQHDEFTETTLRTPFTLWLTADNQYRMDSKSKMGSSLQICDGEKNWNYISQTNRYFVNTGKSDPAYLFDSQVDLRTPASKLKEAKILRQETLETGGAKHLCQVIQASYERKQKKGSMEFGDVTFWVEQDTYLVWKTSVTMVVDMGKYGGKTPGTETTLYSSIQLNAEPPSGTFVFTPPAGATEQKPGGSDKRSNALLGRPAPDFKLRNLDGKEVQLADFKGKVVLLDFWATWCEPCREEMPKLNKLSKEFKDKDVVLLGIDVGEDEDTVRSFIKENGYQYPILLTSSPGDPVFDSYAAHSYPSMVLIDRKGLVADYKVGSGESTEQTLRDDFTRVLAANYVPPTPSAEPKATVTTSSKPVVEWPDPVTAIDFLQRGYRNLRDKSYTSAIQDANAALKLKPDWASAIRLRAQASYDAKDYDAAVNDYTALIEKYPDWGQMYNQRGLGYSYGGKHDLAIPDYTKAIELDRYVASFHNNRGWAYRETGDIENAIRDLNDAIGLSPEYTRAYENRAKAFDKRNDLHSELADLDVILRIAPTNQWAKNQRDDVRKRMGLDAAPGEPESQATADTQPATPAPVAIPLTESIDSSLAAPKLISPPDDSVFTIYPRRTTLQWEASEGAVSYIVEWDYSYRDLWHSEDHPATRVGYPCTATTFTFHFVGAQPGRWRIWPVNAAGERGQASEWRTFRYLR